MTTYRLACPFPYSPTSLNDTDTFDRLHRLAALLADEAREIDGIGGTKRATNDELGHLVMSAERVIATAKDALDLAVDTMRDHGWSWDMVGNELGISRQAAQKRFGGGK